MYRAWPSVSPVSSACSKLAGVSPRNGCTCIVLTAKRGGYTQTPALLVLLSDSSALHRILARSSNGRTPDFESGNGGSNPSLATCFHRSTEIPLRDRLMAGRLTLDQEMEVRILLSQPGAEDGENGLNSLTTLYRKTTGF